MISSFFHVLAFLKPLILKICTITDIIQLHSISNCHIADLFLPVTGFLGERLGRESRFYGENCGKMAELLKSIVKVRRVDHFII